MKTIRIISIILLLLLSACSSGSSDGRIQEAEGAQITMQDLQGKVNVSDGEKDIEAFAGMNLYNGYGVGTEKESYDWILLDETKLVKMNQLSRTSIEQDGKKLKVILEEGDLFFCVSEELKEDEELTFETENMSLSIRGTCGIVRYHRNLCYVAILEGEAELQLMNGLSNSFTLDEGDAIIITPEDYQRTQIYPYGDVPGFIQEELANNEMVMTKMEDTQLDLDFASDEEVSQIVQQYTGKFLYKGSIGAKEEDYTLDFDVSEPYTIEITVTEDGLLIFDREESQKAYEAIEEFNRKCEEKGYSMRYQHLNSHVEMPFARFKEPNVLHIPDVGYIYLWEDGTLGSSPTPFIYSSYERIE